MTHATRVIRCGERTLAVGRTPLVMGVLNVTPDSFSDGGRYLSPDRAVEHARAMAAAGAAIVDVGGESTRPGAVEVPEEEETSRVLPVIEALFERGDPGFPVSIDTRKPGVAAAAIARGCTMVNDIGGGEDPAMVEALRAAGEGVAVVVMHKRGDPRTMQESPCYDDVVAEVTSYLDGRASALAAAGVSRERIVLDPGIGFGKRYRDNLELLNHIDALRALGYPVLIGASRKRFIGELSGTSTDDRLAGSLAVAARCLDAGVDIVRVHDVAETVALFRTMDAIDHPTDYFKAD